MTDQQPQLPEPQISVVYDEGGVRIHTFISPDAFLANATHVIETADSLVIIDGQFVVPFAMGFRGYVDSLAKPIDRLFLSHAHVDHFFGIGAAFNDVNVYAPAETIEIIKSDGEAMRQDRAKEFGPFVADKVVVPQNVVTDGSETIGGIEYRYEIVHNTECSAALLTTLPELGVTIAQDLIYSGGHLYLVRDVAPWVSVLRRLQESPSELFLAGHGPVADKDEIETNIEYLQTGEKTFASAAGPEEFKAAMLAAYPDRAGTAILDIYVPRLYGLASE